MRIFLVILSVLLIAGCATLGQMPPSVCDSEQAECSKICEIAANMGMTVEDLDVIILTVNYTLIERGAYSVEDVTAIFDAIEVAAQVRPNYAGLVVAIEYTLGDVPPELMIISPVLNRLRIDDPICEFDRALVVAHIEHQREMLSKYLSEPS